MTKEELIALGLSEEQAKSVLKGFKDYVAKADYDEVVAEKVKLEGDIKERDTQLGNLTKSVKNIEDLEATITALQEDNKKKDEDHKAEFSKLKIDNAIDLAITKSKGKNPKAIKALLDMEGIVLDKDGKITGLDKQLEKLTKGDDSSFLFGEKSETLKGASPSNQGGNINTGITKEQFDKMGYKERVNLFNTNKALHDTLANASASSTETKGE